MLGREDDVGQNVVLAIVHQGGEFWPTRPQLIGNVAPGLMRGLGIGLQKGLADRGGDHGVLAFGHMGQGVAHPMNAAPLPGRTEHPGDRMAQPVVSVGDHQLDGGCQLFCVWESREILNVVEEAHGHGASD
jgi:hypothetical protein